LSDVVWSLADHACRFCLGRVLRHKNTFRCSDCGVSCQGGEDGIPKEICGCGMKVDAIRQRTGTTDVFRCGPNPHRSHNSPAEIVILFGAVAAIPAGDV
jgi:hypothetical protein